MNGEVDPINEEDKDLYDSLQLGFKDAPLLMTAGLSLSISHIPFLLLISLDIPLNYLLIYLLFLDNYLLYLPTYLSLICRLHYLLHINPTALNQILFPDNFCF